VKFSRGKTTLEDDADFYGATIHRADNGHDNAIVCYGDVAGDPRDAERVRDAVLRRLDLHDELVEALRVAFNHVDRDTHGNDHALVAAVLAKVEVR